jgi:hypothetical protein
MKGTLDGIVEPVIQEEATTLEEERTLKPREKSQKKSKKPEFKQDPWNGEIATTQALKHEFV